MWIGDRQKVCVSANLGQLMILIHSPKDFFFVQNANFSCFSKQCLLSVLPSIHKPLKHFRPWVQRVNRIYNQMT